MIDRKTKPKSEAELNFILPEIQEAVLSNGLKIIYIQKDKLPITRLNLIVEAGSKFDPLNLKGLSNLTSLVMDEGADGLSALEISDSFDTLGSSFSVASDSESITLKLQTLTENLDSSLNIFSKVLLKPDFNQTDFEREKRIIKTNLLQLKNEPDFLANKIFNALVLGNGNPYSPPVRGFIDDINNINNDAVKIFYLNTFSPANSNIVAVGNLPFEKFLTIIESYLGDWQSSSSKTDLTFNYPAGKKRIYVFNKKDSVQSEIRVGHRSLKRTDYNFFSRTILNTILGGQFTSRINLNIREDKGYSYGAFSSFSYFKDDAYFYVSTSVSNEKTSDTLKEIYFELENIQEGITEAELEFASSSIVKKFPSNFETYKQITGNLTSKVLFSLPDNYFNNYIDNIKSVSIQQVNQAAKDLIHPENALCVVVGDMDKIADSLMNVNIEIVEVDEKGIIK